MKFYRVFFLKKYHRLQFIIMPYTTATLDKTLLKFLQILYIRRNIFLSPCSRSPGTKEATKKGPPPEQRDDPILTREAAGEHSSGEPLMRPHPSHKPSHCSTPTPAHGGVADTPNQAST